MAIETGRLESLDDRSRTSWKPWLAVLCLSAIGNLALAPNWNTLQASGTAREFVAELDHPLRVLTAAACDLVFAASYGLLGYVGLRRWGTTRLASIAAIAVLAGAAADELENSILIVSVIRRANVSDASIDLMRVPGTLKWVAAPAVLLLYAYLLRAARRRRSPARSA